MIMPIAKTLEPMWSHSKKPEGPGVPAEPYRLIGFYVHNGANMVTFKLWVRKWMKKLPVANVLCRGASRSALTSGGSRTAPTWDPTATGSDLTRPDTTPNLRNRVPSTLIRKFGHVIGCHCWLASSVLRQALLDKPAVAPKPLPSFRRTPESRLPKIF